jgi:ABC-type multidrug transport system fused ATPase/permease subunit
MNLRERVRRTFAPTAESSALVGEAPALPLTTILKRFWPYARPYRKWIAISLVFVVLAPAIDTALIWMFKLVVDDVLVPRDFAPFIPLALAYVGLTIAGGLVDFLDDYLTTWTGERFLLRLRTSVFGHLQSLGLDFFERRRLGDLISRLTGDVSSIESLVLSGIVDALSYALRIAFFTAALFYLQWDLALVSLTVAPLFFFLGRRFTKRIKTASREKRRRSGSISAVAEESLGNAPLVQAYNRQGAEVERFHRENQGSFAATMAATRLKATFTPLVDLIELFGALIVIGMGTWELTQGRLSLGGLLVFLAFLSQLYSPIRGLTKLANTFFSASASAERIIELLDEEPAVKVPAAPVRLGRARGEVELNDVTFRYPGAARDALHDVSLRVEPGESVALVGPSGAGKSTIARLLLRFHDPSLGAVRLDGHDLREFDPAELRDNVALLLQETLVFDGTVAENIAIGKPDATQDEIEAAARAADAHDFIERLPDGYDTSVGQRGRRLSGGQRQRVAIARAMIRDAPVLILDEPVTGVDVESGERILEPLRRLMHDRATLVISHDFLTIRDATRIVVLDEGRVVETGTRDELLDRGERYAAMEALA